MFDKLRDSMILMLQWVLWKHLAPRLNSLDGERMQRLAEQLAHDMYDEGVRMPIDDEDHASDRLAADIINASREVTDPPLPPVAWFPKHVLRERSRKVAARLARDGWRKVATAALVVVELAQYLSANATAST